MSLTRRRRIALIAVAVLLLAAIAGGAAWLFLRSPSATADVDPGRATRIALGDEVIVDIPAHAVNAAGSATVRVANGVDRPRGLRTGTLYELVFSAGVHLVGQATVTLPHPADAGPQTWFAQQQSGGTWSAGPLGTPAGRSTVSTGEIIGGTPFGVGWLDGDSLRTPLAALADSALHGTPRSAVPECPDADQLEKQGVTVEAATEDVRWCAGFTTGRLVVRLASSRAYPLVVRYEDTAAFAGRRGGAAVTWFTDRFEQSTVAQERRTTIVRPGEQAEFGIDRIWQGKTTFTSAAEPVAFLAVLGDAALEAYATAAADLGRIGVLAKTGEPAAIAAGWDLSACGKTADTASAQGADAIEQGAAGVLACVAQAAAPAFAAAPEHTRPVAGEALTIATGVWQGRPSAAAAALTEAADRQTGTLTVTYPRASSASLLGTSLLTGGGSRHMLLMDVSGSMADNDGTGTIKMDGGKAAVQATLDGMPASALVGLRTFPAAGSDCGSRLQSGLTSPQDKKLRQQVANLKPNGGTPTAPALRAAVTDLVRAGLSADSAIILVSDGESNCGGDPCAVARDIAALGVAVVHTVGFSVSPQGKAELQCISQATGGRYFDASDAASLRAAISAAANPSLAVTLESPAAATAAAGEPVALTVTVANVSARVVNAARVVLSFPPGSGNVDPGAPSPVRGLGNLQPQETRKISWHFEAPPQPGGASAYTVVAAAGNAAPARTAGVIKYVSALTQADGGPLLSGAKHPILIGDSYASGDGGGAYDAGSGSCHRSGNGIGATVFRPAPRVVACAGTTVATLTLAEVATATDPADLALIMLGGDDVGLAEILRYCAHTAACQDTAAYPNPALTQDCLSRYRRTGAFDAAQRYIGHPVAEARSAIPTQPGCADFTVPYADMAMARVAAVSRSLPTAYAAIDAALNRSGQRATMVVLAYPRLTPPVGENRGFCAGFDPAELRFTDELTQRLNTTIQAAVDRARGGGAAIAYAPDVADALQGNHTACDRQPHVVVTPNAAPQELMHPDAAGYLAITTALVRWSTRPDATVDLRTHKTVAAADPESVSGSVRVAPSPPSARLTSGTVVTVRGDGFAPGSPVTLTVASGQQAIGVGHPGADGVLAADAALPVNLVPGPQTIIATGFAPDGTPRWAYAVVTVSRPTPLWRLLLWAGAFLVVSAGLACWWVWRRRRSSQPLSQRVEVG